jgi:hypothetical protein
MVNSVSFCSNMLPPSETGLISMIGSTGDKAMPAIVSNERLSRPLLLLAVFGGLIMAATLALWAYYGTTVFLEIVRTGWATCF